MNYITEHRNMQQQILAMFAAIAKPVHTIHGNNGENSCSLCDSIIEDKGKAITFEYNGTKNVEYVCLYCYLNSDYNQIIKEKAFSIKDFKN